MMIGERWREMDRGVGGMEGWMDESKYDEGKLTAGAAGRKAPGTKDAAFGFRDIAVFAGRSI